MISRVPLILILVGGASTVPALAHASIPPSDCGLDDDDPDFDWSGVLIESCINPGFDPVDVWIDSSTDHMYVARGLDTGEPHTTRIAVYDISDPATPDHLTDLSIYFGDGVDLSASVGGGDGMIFNAPTCQGGCGGGGVHVQGWNACDDWDAATLFLSPDPGPDEWSEETASHGMHTLWYDANEGLVYGANNGLADASFFVPVWSVGTACPIDGPTPEVAIGVDGLIAGSSHIHEVVARFGQLGVAAWTDIVIYDVSGGPDAATEIGRVVGSLPDGNDNCAAAACSVHTVFPFSIDHYWVTEERRGGRLRGYLRSGGAMLARGSAGIPSNKGASYHEIAFADYNAHFSAYQAGLRTWRYDPEIDYYVIGAFLDTSPEDCAGGCDTGTSWPGATGISIGEETNSRRLVAVANMSETTSYRRVFLLSVFTPDTATCTGPSCTWTVPVPSGQSGNPDLLVARSSDDSVSRIGKLVRYPASGGGLGSPTTLSQSGLSATHGYGSAAAIGDFNRDGRADVAVGAPGQSVGGIASGVVYVYGRTSTGNYSLMQTLDQASLGSNAAGDRFGAALAAGDFDNDGDDDLVVGAPAATEVSGVPAGAVFAFRGSSTGLSGWSAIANTTNVRAGDRFGAALARGDFNGDAVPDFVVGAPHGRILATSPHAGVVHVYKGKTGALPSFHSRKAQSGLDSDEVGDRFGAWLAVGDWNNDGRDDLAVGAPDEHIGDVLSGRVYAFVGSTSSMLITWSSRDQTNLDTNEEGDLFGHQVAAGDFDGDGFDDLVVSGIGESVSPGVRSGKIYVFRGSTSNLLAQVAHDQATLQTNDDLDGFGHRLGVGDWNADGKLDVAVTAPGFPSGAATNPLYLFKGSATGPLAWQTLTVP